MAEFWMGVDLGTSGVRAVIVGADGDVVGEGASPLRSERNGDRHEQDPEEWWRAVCEATQQALRVVGPESVRALAVCATSGTMCLVDGDGTAMTAGIMYDDGRAAEQARLLTEDGVLQRFGHSVQPGWALAKLLWFLDRGEVEPGWRLGHQSDVVVRGLVGDAVAADSSHALKTGYDPAAFEWPSELFDVAGIPRDVLPRVVRSGSVLGEVSVRAAEITGLAAGTSVVAGMTDGCAGQLAAGAVEVGSVNSVLGTTLVLKGVTEDPFDDPTGVVYSHRSPDGHWLPGGASNVGAGILLDVFPDADIDQLIVRAAFRRPASTVAYPLVGRGERFPFLVPDAEGFILGEPQDEVEYCAAIVQSVAYVERLAVDHLALHGAVLGGGYSSTGGGTKSPEWCQIRADVLGRPITVPERPESAFGMAVLASASDRRVSLAEAARGMVRIRAEYLPAADAEDAYRDNYLLLVGALSDRDWISLYLADYTADRRWAA